MITIHGKPKILVVDDQPTVRDDLEQLLKANDYQTVSAAGGEDALVRASEQEFEVVLLDIRMPGLSGIDVLRRLYPDRPDIGVIMVSGVADVATAVEAMKIGAYDYVTKPWNPDDLLVRVKKARERRYLTIQVKQHQRHLREKLAQQAKELRELSKQTVHALIQQEILEHALEGPRRKRKGELSLENLKQIGAKILRHLNDSWPSTVKLPQE